MANPSPTIGLNGASISEALIVQELNAAKLKFLGTAFLRCVTHTEEDSLPFHPGEKTCVDRYFSKLSHALELSKEAKREFDARGQDVRDGLLPKWIAALDNEHKHHHRNTKI